MDSAPAEDSDPGAVQAAVEADDDVEPEAHLEDTVPPEDTAPVEDAAPVEAAPPEAVGPAFVDAAHVEDEPESRLMLESAAPSSPEPAAYMPLFVAPEPSTFRPGV